MKVSTLPRLTWNWVTANNAEVRLPLLTAEKKFTQYESHIALGADFDGAFEGYSHGLSEDALKFNLERANWKNDQVYQGSSERNYIIRLTKAEDRLIDIQKLHLKEGSETTLIYDYTSEKGAEAFRSSVFEILAEEDSKLKLILIQRLDKDAFSMCSVGAILKGNAKVDVVQIELGAQKTYFNKTGYLLEKGADCRVNTSYFSDEDRIIDLSYLLKHVGQETNADMHINGALKDRARKRFVGTLDFLKGSNGSVGNEEEFVTLLDEEVKAIALPLLLAHEHDIVGNHAASAGRIDQDMLYYIMSRGFSEKEAKSIVVEAKMTPAIDMIPDEKLREEIKESIHEAITK